MLTRAQIAAKNAVRIRMQVRGLPKHARLRRYEEIAMSWMLPVRWLRQISDAGVDSSAQKAVEGRSQ